MRQRKLLLLTLLLSSSTLLASCSGDNRFPRTFEVNFITDSNTESIEKKVVKEGYRIDGVGTPQNSQEAIFDGWYIVDSEGNELEYFDIENYRVFNDLTLKAKWTYPSINPVNITLGSDAFTKSITWIQKDIDVLDIGVRAKVGNMVTTYSYNENYDKNLISGMTIEYGEGAYTDLDGVVSKEDDYHYKFTLTNPDNVYYGIEIYSKTGGFDTANANDIHFKGEGTESNPYLVYNENDLRYLTVNNFDNNTYAKLMNDITISSIYGEKVGCVFDGHLDGNKSYGDVKIADNYTITLKNNSGLFMNLGEHAQISNINFRGTVYGSNPSLGVVANYSSGRISKVDSTAVSVNNQGGRTNDINTISKGGSGGIVGTNLEKGVINNCTVSSARDNVISGHIAVGGVAGVNYGTIEGMRCDAIIGAYNGNEISLTVENSFSGCVVGVNYGKVSKIDVYNGKINTRRIDKGSEGDGSNNVGGVVGYNATTGIIDQCQFDGMRCVGDTNVGGIAGYNDGTITNCYTGRRLRSPSNTTVPERRFISPVIGSYNVGGIAGKIGEHSHISNVFSTANVYSYGMKGYTIAEKADNCVGVSFNQNPRSSNSYLGQKYGEPYSSSLVQPAGNNVLTVDNSFIIGVDSSWGLGYVYKDGVWTVNEKLVVRYLNCLGDKFGFRNSYSHGIRLLYESSVQPLSELGF